MVFGLLSAGCEYMSVYQNSFYEDWGRQENGENWYFVGFGIVLEGREGFILDCET